MAIKRERPANPAAAAPKPKLQSQEGPREAVFDPNKGGLLKEGAPAKPAGGDEIDVEAAMEPSEAIAARTLARMGTPSSGRPAYTGGQRPEGGINMFEAEPVEDGPPARTSIPVFKKDEASAAAKSNDSGTLGVVEDDAPAKTAPAAPAARPAGKATKSQGTSAPKKTPPSVEEQLPPDSLTAVIREMAAHEKRAPGIMAEDTTSAVIRGSSSGNWLSRLFGGGKGKGRSK